MEIALLLVVCILFFIPKLSAIVLPQKQTYSLNKFLKQTEVTRSINPQQFWQFREFYSPGYFQLDTNHLDRKGVLINGNYATQAKYFIAPQIQSVDALTITSSLSTVLQVENIQKVILQTSDILVVQRKNDIVLAFILPQSEMEKANGLFNYEEDTEILKGKNWLDVTVIKLN